MLIDTNILMEIGKRQAKSTICRDLFSAIQCGMINETAYVTRFALGALEAMLSSVDDSLIRKILLMAHLNQIKIFETKVEDDLMINSIKKDLKLDFDDALQFFAANRLGTYLVTYDKDFSHTSLETKTPQEVLDELAKI